MASHVEADFIPLIAYSLSEDELNGHLSDEIDEEIEHRLYSLIHHDSDLDLSLRSQSHNSPQVFGRPILNKKLSQSVEVIDLADNQSLNTKTAQSDKSIVSSNFKPTKPKSNNVVSLNGKKKGKALKILKDNIRNFKKSSLISHVTSTISSSSSESSENWTDPASVSNDWKVDDKDKGNFGRYYRKSKFCEHCKKYGNHPIKLCPLSKKEVCYFCCSVDHIGQNCPNRYCNRCMDFHKFKGCSLNYHNSICQNCNLYGHIAKYCPNNWRKYFTTTQLGIDPNLSFSKLRISKNRQRFCGNCGFDSHYTFECQTFFKQNNFIPSSPYVFETRSKYCPTQESTLANSCDLDDSKRSVSKKKTKNENKADIEKINKFLEIRKAKLREKARKEQVKEIRRIIKKAKKDEKLKKKKKYKKMEKKRKEQMKMKKDKSKPTVITLD